MKHPLEGSYRGLWIVYGVLPVAAGFDKFVGLLADWPAYIAPVFARLLPLAPETFMQLVGIIEIAAGVLVFLVPRLGARIVTAWLLCIAFNLVAGGQYLDVAVRDIGLAVGAWVLGRLADVRQEHPLDATSDLTPHPVP